MTRRTVELGPKISVSAQEASHLSGLSRSTLYSLMKDGQLPFVKIGARRLIMVKDLDDLLGGSRQPRPMSEAL